MKSYCLEILVKLDFKNLYCIIYFVQEAFGIYLTNDNIIILCYKLILWKKKNCNYNLTIDFQKYLKNNFYHYVLLNNELIHFSI